MSHGPKLANQSSWKLRLFDWKLEGSHSEFLVLINIKPAGQGGGGGGGGGGVGNWLFKCCYPLPNYCSGFSGLSAPYFWEVAVYLVLGVGSIPVAILSFCQDMKSIAS